MLFLLILIIAGAVGAGHKQTDQQMYDLNFGKKVSMSEALTVLKQKRVILVGEHHSNIKHHEVQRDVIRMLKEAGMQVAIGLEMFRSDSQKALDRWIDGEIGEKNFQQIYYNNWSYPWSAYRVIFDYAREEKIPLIGLNVSRNITRQVAQHGFKSLTPEQRGTLSDVTCRVDKAYMDYIKSAFGAHAHGDLNFNYFCEAQLVWDTVMAINTLNYLKKYPDAVVVVLTGMGHAQKGAVPRQIRERSQTPLAVILPEVKDSVDPETVTSKDADYIMLES